MAGIPDTSQATIENLAELVPKGDTIGLVGFSINMEPHFKKIFDGMLYQMVIEKIPDYEAVEYVELSKDDTPEITELVKLTEPGPFAPNVIELGKYIGIRNDGKLVAMAGERVKIDGYTAISLVCTHPDYRGKGYAKALSGVLIEDIIKRGETPFLNVATDNVPAITLYEKLGFKKRKESPVAGIYTTIVRAQGLKHDFNLRQSILNTMHFLEKRIVLCLCHAFRLARARSGQPLRTRAG